LSALESGEYYLNRYEGPRNRMAPAGTEPKAALAKPGTKRLELACVAAGGEIKKDNNPPAENGKRRRISTAIKRYLEDCFDRLPVATLG